MAKNPKSTDERIPPELKGSIKKGMWIAQHIDRIREYLKEHTLEDTAEHFGISCATVSNIKSSQWSKRRASRKSVADSDTLAGPSSTKSIPVIPDNVSASDVAHAILDTLINMKSELCVLKSQNSDLRYQVGMLERQLEAVKENEQTEFRSKLERVLAMPGEV